MRLHAYLRGGGEEWLETTVQYGAQVDLTGTDLDLILDTKDFPTERKS